ncbi:hypothetical protein, partial [Nitrosomonas nitrosa]|uniref:hypothetical protein n=1 Tax=Nitrosomonas nitrosa TaxID=52442 RepID=UPI0023F98F9E
NTVLAAAWNDKTRSEPQGLVGHSESCLTVKRTQEPDNRPAETVNSKGQLYEMVHRTGRIRKYNLFGKFFMAR